MVGRLTRFQLPTVPYLPNQVKSASSRENRLFVSSNSYHPPLQEALQLHEGGRGMSVSEVILTPGTGAQHEFCITSMGAIFKYM